MLSSPWRTSGFCDKEERCSELGVMITLEAIKAGLEAGEFFLEYLPAVSLVDGRCIGRKRSSGGGAQAPICLSPLLVRCIGILTVLYRLIFTGVLFRFALPARVHFSGGGVELVEHGLESLAGGEGFAILRVGRNERLGKRSIFHIEQLAGFIQFPICLPIIPIPA